MVAKRIIPCLDVCEDKVVKGVRFKNHQILGDIIDLAIFYAESGADELVFYDIKASCEDRSVSTKWIENVARQLDIPFCVAGGISTIDQAEKILAAGADKISINTPALLNPNLISELSKQFGQQCVVIGIDSWEKDGKYQVCKFSGDPSKTQQAYRNTTEWVHEVSDRGAGEIVLNCMNHDGVKQGYDLKQLSAIREKTRLPIIASGGAGKIDDFKDVFSISKVDGALAASVFHSKSILINDLKRYLSSKGVEVRI